MKTMINFQDLSDMGLIWKINKEILHPLGLALCRDGESSPGVKVSEDGEFQYSPEADIRNSAKYNTTVSNHKEGNVLRNIL